MTRSQRLTLFNDFWDTIDESFACFQDLDVDWLAVKNTYLAEIFSGVSKGRFSAIMNQLSLALRESHTFITDLDVSLTNPEPGIPIMYYGGWGDVGHFGVASGGALLVGSVRFILRAHVAHVRRKELAPL